MFIKKKAWLKLPIIAFLILLFFIVVLSTYLGKEYIHPDVVKFLTDENDIKYAREDFLYDYDYLWKLLEDNYVFFPILEHNGVDVNSVKENTRNLLETQELDLQLFFIDLDNMFKSMDYFAHLSLLDRHGYDLYCMDYSSNNGTGNNNYYNELLFDRRVATTYKHLAADDFFLTSSNNTGVDLSYDSRKKMILFKVKSFDRDFIEQDREHILVFLNDISEHKLSVENIVFDITGNVGGDDNYWIRNFVDLFGGDYKWESWIYYKETELTRDIFCSVDAKPIEMMPISHSLPNFVQQLGLTHYFNYCFEITAKYCYFSEAKRWVLIDNNVYSSADTFASFCKASNWATLVGKSTGGDGIGVAPILIKLPRTGLLVRFSVTCGETESGELNALKGTTPNINCIRGETPTETLFRILETKKVDKQ